MTRSYTGIAVAALALALLLPIGCKKAEAPPAAPQPAATAPGTPAQPAATPAPEKGAEPAAAPAAVAEAQPQPTPNPPESPAAAIEGGAPAAAEALPIDEKKLDKLVEYSEAMATILEQNAADPAAAAKALEEYLGKNKEERDALLQEFEGLKDKLTPEQQSALGMKLLTKLGPLMQRMQKLFTDHPELASDPRIRDAMTSFKGK